MTPRRQKPSESMARAAAAARRNTDVVLLMELLDAVVLIYCTENLTIVMVVMEQKPEIAGIVWSASALRRGYDRITDFAPHPSA